MILIAVIINNMCYLSLSIQEAVLIFFLLETVSTLDRPGLTHSAPSKWESRYLSFQRHLILVFWRNICNIHCKDIYIYIRRGRRVKISTINNDKGWKDNEYYMY